MPTVEERLASVEARMDRMDDLHLLIAGLRTEMTEFRGDMNRQFADLRADTNRQFGELRAERNSRLQALDMKVDRHFAWVVGIQMTIMLAVLGAMVGAYYR
jgi:hypothetical protein